MGGCEGPTQGCGQVTNNAWWLPEGKETVWACGCGSGFNNSDACESYAYEPPGVACNEDLDCFDNNECTADTCLNPGDTSSSCQRVNKPDGTPCTLGVCGGGICIPNELCNDGIDNNGNGYTDEADKGCAIRLTAAPASILPTQTSTLTVAAQDGGLNTGGRPISICDYRGCGSSGCAAADGLIFAGTTTTVTLTTPEVYGYWACTGLNSASAAVTVRAVCGNGVVETDAMETCDPPNTRNYTGCPDGQFRLCTSSCRWGACVGCGDGVKQSWETCDPPGRAGGALCSPGVYQTCKDDCSGYDCRAPTWFYGDRDRDTFGDPTNKTQAYNPPSGYVANDDDCNDNTRHIRPGVQEGLIAGYCTDGLDNNCPPDAGVGEADFDAYTGGAVPANYGGSITHGDPTCLVKLFDLQIPTLVATDNNFVLKCIANTDARSIVASTSPTTGACTRTGSRSISSGQYEISFSCKVTDDREHTATCAITDDSYNGTPDLSTTFIPLDCDKDGDGHNRNHTVSGVQYCGTGPYDCNDTNLNIHPAVFESGAMCTDAVDNDCDYVVDYDGFTSGQVQVNYASTHPTYNGWFIRGDSGCNITAQSAATFGPSCYGSAGHTSVNCTYDVGNVRSAVAFINWSGVLRQCEPSDPANPWTGTTARFNCSTASAANPQFVTINCSVNQTVSTQVGTDKMVTVPTVGYDQLCDASCGVCNAEGVCMSNVTWKGYLLDDSTDLVIATKGNVSWGQDKKTVAPSTEFEVKEVPVCPNHDIFGEASGYDPKTVINVKFDKTIFRRNLSLEPTSCKSDCTFGGVCDFRCLGQGGCSLDSIPSALDRGNISQVCQYATPGSIRTLDSGRVVSCCVGPIMDRSLYSVPLTLESCTETIVPHRTLVTVDGKIVQLTIASYNSCR